MSVRYDWQNGEKIYNDIKQLLSDNGYDVDGYWMPDEENAYELEPDGELECEEGYVNINSNYNDEYDNSNCTKPFNVEVHEFTDYNITNGIKAIIAKYPGWEIIS